MPQLDGLRGLAIFGVFLAHFLQLPIESPFFLPYGSMGVRLFFVLSGFLITGILVKARKRIDNGEQTAGFTLRAFYMRRCLRLFVVFYIWIIVNQIVFGGERFWWDFFYASNFFDILYKNGNGNHYWSLAVEEQFYLVWPWLILFLNKRYWPSVFGGCIAIAIATRIILAVNGIEYLIVKKLPFTCMDCLAAGALLAWLNFRDEPWNRKTQLRWASILGISGAAFFAVAIWDLKSTGTKGLIYTSTLHTASAAMFAGILIPAIEGYEGATGKLLSFGPLCWLGKISYGCYLYHLLVRGATDSICSKLAVDLPILIDFSIKTLLSVLVAWLSWTILETRVNKLKKYFPMRQQETES